LCPSCRHGRRVRLPEIVGTATLVAVLAACSNAPPSVSEALSEACADARRGLASAPAPTGPESEAAFRRAADEATRIVGDVADEVAHRGDDRTIADLAWQLHRFPSARDESSLRAAHEASAAIVRIDRFARTLDVPECGAATWRPADWRALADRLAERPSEDEFRRDLNELCEETFPNPSLLSAGVPLLTALVADPKANAGAIDLQENVKGRLIPRLRPASDRPGDTRRFLTALSNDLPELQPPESLDDEYVALLSALIGLDAAVPRAMPRDPPPAVREHLGAALDELEQAWEALDITC
jgi:hypothetical protein